MNPTQTHRTSRQRQVILEELQALASHPTAAELYERVRRRLPKVSLGTVYRNLELLARLGKIQKLDFGGDEGRFDGDLRRHDHVRCVECGRLDDIPGRAVDLPERVVNDCTDYQMLGFRLEFLGVCPQCQRRRNDALVSHNPR